MRARRTRGGTARSGRDCAARRGGGSGARANLTRTKRLTLRPNVRRLRQVAVRRRLHPQQAVHREHRLEHVLLAVGVRHEVAARGLVAQQPVQDVARREVREVRVEAVVPAVGPRRRPSAADQKYAPPSCSCRIHGCKSASMHTSPSISGDAVVLGEAPRLELQDGALAVLAPRLDLVASRPRPRRIDISAREEFQRLAVDGLDPRPRRASRRSCSAEKPAAKRMRSTERLVERRIERPSSWARWICAAPEAPL